MAFPKQTAFILLVALVTLSFTTTSNAVECVGKGKIAVYWGQGSKQTEGTLESVCSSGKYNIVILDQLLVYDDGKDPVLNLENHCDTDCHTLQDDIKSCQKNKIQVFLSIGSDTLTQSPNTSVSDPKAAETLANYLFEKYLSGKDGPLGKVALDGIDFADVAGGKNLKWDEVVNAIHDLPTTARKIYLSASPQCVYPDTLLGKAINTGHFDYIWVEFFFPNPTCDYADGDASKLLSAFEKWTKNVPKSFIFLGLTASKDSKQYIPPDDLVSKVLKSAKHNDKYGGVMISSMVDDLKNGYTSKIKDSVPKDCKCLCDGDATFAANAFYGLPSASI